MRDPLNCGKCGRSCESGTCLLGNCTPIVLAESQQFPQYCSIVVGATHVYWTTKYGVMSATLGANWQVKMIAPSQATPRGLAIYGLNSDLFWGDEAGSINHVSGSGGAVARLFTDAMLRPTRLVADPDSNNIYFTDLPADVDKSSIMQVSRQGGTPTVLAPQARVSALTLDATSLYWINFSTTGVLMTMPRAGGTPRMLSAALDSHAVAVFNGEVFWNDGRQLMKSSTAGGGATMLARTADILDIVVARNSVYWVDGASVWRVPTAGGEAEQLASSQNGACALALNENADALHWLNSRDGTVMRRGLY